MTLTDSINIRLLQQSDINFILSSSIKCLLIHKDSLFKGWNQDNLSFFLEKSILKILNKPDISVFIACDRENEDHIFAYIVADPKLNHIYLQYSKYAYRNLGIQKHLLIPLVINQTEPITIQYATHKVLPYIRSDRLFVYDHLMEF